MSFDHACALLIVVASVGLFCFGRAYGHPYSRAGVQPIHLLGGFYWACGIVALLASWCDFSEAGMRRARGLLLFGASVGGLALLVLFGLTAAKVSSGVAAVNAMFGVAATAAFAVHVRGFLHLVQRTKE